MPIAAAIPIIAAGIQAASSIYGAAQQGSMNSATRQWNETMYSRQREDALADWNRQNEYNSPAAQMDRYKAAGLNPNLIYGQTNEAPAVRSTDVKSWTPTAPDVSGVGRAAMGALGSYQDITMQNEQMKNLDAQRTNMQLEAVMKGAQIAALNLQNAKNLRLYDTSIATAEELLRGISTRTDIAVSSEARNAALQAPTLAAAFARAANIGADTEVKKAQLENLKRSGVLQDMEIGMRKLGMSWHDPLWARMIAQFADGKPLPQVIKGLWSNLVGAMGTDMPSKAIARYLGTKDFGYGPRRDSSGGFEQFKFSDWFGK